MDAETWLWLWIYTGLGVGIASVLGLLIFMLYDVQDNGDD